MIIPLTIGALVGFGLWLIVLAVVPNRDSLVGGHRPAAPHSARSPPTTPTVSVDGSSPASGQNASRAAHSGAPTSPSSTGPSRSTPHTSPWAR